MSAATAFVHPRAAILSAILLTASLAACAPAEEDEPVGETSAAYRDPNDPTWPCYEAEPGHPTPSEQEAFFANRAAAATEAERTYGVPAAGMLAIAALEGGFGFTRIAQFANNEFGYKFTSSAAAGGRGAWTLACQPSWDVGNRYVVFHDKRDGILFVAMKLATRADWANYKAATDAYRAARRSGADVTAAVNAWVDGIADAGYNYDPPSYKRALKAMLSRFGLYRYSAAIMPGGGDATPPAAGGGAASPSAPSTSGWVAIDAPAANVSVRGFVPVEASASSNVTKVTVTTIASNGYEYVLGSSGPPFDFVWATAGWVPNGWYTLRFDAYVGTTKVASASRRVYVSN